MRREPYRFRLYIAGDTPNSALAVANLNAICQSHLPDQHEIEVVDLFREPKLALANRILITPTLVKLGPLPVRSIVGTLTDTATVLHALGVKPVPI